LQLVQGDLLQLGWLDQARQQVPRNRAAVDRGPVDAAAAAAAPTAPLAEEGVGRTRGRQRVSVVDDDNVGFDVVNLGTS